MRNKRVSDYIAESIQNEILSGRMESGQPLRQEDLAESLGYSRIPIREALQLLEAQGLVRRLATRHIVVADFSDSVIHEIFDLLCQLEAKCLKSLKESGVSMDFPESEMDPEMQFHQYICEHISNAYFVGLLEKASDSYIRYAVKETVFGRENGKQKERMELLQKICELCGKELLEDTYLETVAPLLLRYYQKLAENVISERRATR